MVDGAGDVGLGATPCVDVDPPPALVVVLVEFDAGATRKYVPATSVKPGISDVNSVTLKFVTLDASNEDGVVNVGDDWRYIRSTYRCAGEPAGGDGPRYGLNAAVWFVRMNVPLVGDWPTKSGPTKCRICASELFCGVGASGSTITMR